MKFNLEFYISEIDLINNKGKEWVSIQAWSDDDPGISMDIWKETASRIFHVTDFMNFQNGQMKVSLEGIEGGVENRHDVMSYHVERVDEEEDGRTLIGLIWKSLASETEIPETIEIGVLIDHNQRVEIEKARDTIVFTAEYELVATSGDKQFKGLFYRPKK